MWRPSEPDERTTRWNSEQRGRASLRGSMIRMELSRRGTPVRVKGRGGAVHQSPDKRPVQGCGSYVRG